MILHDFVFDFSMDLKATGRPLGLGHTCCRHLSRKPSRTFPPPTFQKPEQVKRPDGTTDRPRGVAAPVLPSLPWWLALQSQTPPHAACGAPRHHARPDVGRRCTADARSSAPARGGENGGPARVSVPFLPFKNTAKKKLAGHATEPNGSARGHGRGVAPEKHEQSRPDVSRLQEHHQPRRRKCGGERETCASYAPRCRRQDDQDGSRGDEAGLGLRGGRGHDGGGAGAGASGVQVGAGVAERAPVDPHLHGSHHRRGEAAPLDSQVRPRPLLQF